MSQRATAARTTRRTRSRKRSPSCSAAATAPAILDSGIAHLLYCQSSRDRERVCWRSMGPIGKIADELLAKGRWSRLPRAVQHMVQGAEAMPSWWPIAALIGSALLNVILIVTVFFKSALNGIIKEWYKSRR